MGAGEQSPAPIPVGSATAKSAQGWLLANPRFHGPSAKRATTYAGGSSHAGHSAHHQVSTNCATAVAFWACGGPLSGELLPEHVTGNAAGDADDVEDAADDELAEDEAEEERQGPAKQPQAAVAQQE